MTIDLGGDDTHTIRRTTTQPARSIKALAVRHCSRSSLLSWLVNSVQVRESACCAIFGICECRGRAVDASN